MAEDFIDGTNSESRWKLVSAAIALLEEIHTLESIMALVRATARSICSSDGVTFALREGRNCYFADEDAISPLWKGECFPMSRCPSGWSMIHGKTLAIPDIHADPRIPQDIYRHTFVKSLVVTPIRGTGDGSVAAIGVYWKDKRDISEREIAAIEALADGVSGAMKQARPAPPKASSGNGTR